MGTVDSGDGGWKDQRPDICAGEVIKRPKLAIKHLPDKPPPRTGPKLGGARNFLSKRDGDEDSNQNFNKTEVIHQDLANLALSERAKSLAVQSGSGWQRFWSTLTYAQFCKWTKHPRVDVSGICLRCYEDKRPCPELPGRTQHHPDSRVQCQTCRVLAKDCLFMVSYQNHSIDEVALREVANSWQDSQRTPPWATTVSTELTSLHLPHDHQHLALAYGDLERELRLDVMLLQSIARSNQSSIPERHTLENRSWSDYGSMSTISPNFQILLNRKGPIPRDLTIGLPCEQPEFDMQVKAKLQAWEFSDSLSSTLKHQNTTWQLDGSTWQLGQVASNAL